MLPEIDGYSILADLREARRHPGDPPDRSHRRDRSFLGLNSAPTTTWSNRSRPRARRSRRPSSVDREVDNPVSGTDDRLRRPRHRGPQSRGPRRWRASTSRPKEFDLLAFLAAPPARCSRGQLLEHVWDSSPDYQDPSTVTVHVSGSARRSKPTRRTALDYHGLGRRLPVRTMRTIRLIQGSGASSSLASPGSISMQPSARAHPAVRPVRRVVAAAGAAAVARRWHLKHGRFEPPHALSMWGSPG